MKSFLVGILCFALVVSTSAQQTQPVPQSQPLSKRAAKVKQQVATLTKGTSIRVVRRTADEEYGTFISMNDDEFALFDMHTKVEFHLKFEDVRKVKLGYGGASSTPHQAILHPTRLIIGTVILVGGLVLIVALNKD